MCRIQWRIRVRTLLVLVGLVGIAFGVERTIQRRAFYSSKARYHAEFVDGEAWRVFYVLACKYSIETFALPIPTRNSGMLKITWRCTAP